MTFPVPGGSTFLRARSNLADIASAAQALADLGGLGLAAGTALAGYTLVNGTGTILTWTAPSDGKVHPVFVLMVKHITTLEVGGQIQLNYPTPDGTPNNHTPYAGGGAGATLDEEQDFVLIQPGATIVLTQSTALTGGASKLWAQFWAL